MLFLQLCRHTILVLLSTSVYCFFFWLFVESFYFLSPPSSFYGLKFLPFTSCMKLLPFLIIFCNFYIFAVNTRSFHVRHHQPTQSPKIPIISKSPFIYLSFFFFFSFRGGMSTIQHTMASIKPMLVHVSSPTPTSLRSLHSSVSIFYFIQFLNIFKLSFNCSLRLYLGNKLHKTNMMHWIVHQKPLSKYKLVINGDTN